MGDLAEKIMLENKFPSQESSFERLNKLPPRSESRQSSVRDFKNTADIQSPPKAHLHPNRADINDNSSSREDEDLNEKDKSKSNRSSLPKSSSHSDNKKSTTKPSSNADVQDVKSSLKEHYDAIQSLQNALAASGSNSAVFPTKPVAIKRSADQSSQAIRERIKMIESTLREVGENVSVSDTSDQNKREQNTPFSHTRPPSQQEGRRSRNFSPIENKSNQANPGYRAQSPSIMRPRSVESYSQIQTPIPVKKFYLQPHPQPEIQTNSNLLGRLERMEMSMAKLSLLIEDIKEKPIRRQEVSNGSADAIGKLISEVHKLRHDFKAQETVNQEILKKNEFLESQIKLISEPHSSKFLQNGQIDPRIENYCKNLVSKSKSDTLGFLQGKVDTAVLEELVHHIATKEELKNYVKKDKLGKDYFSKKYQKQDNTLNAEDIEAKPVIREQPNNAGMANHEKKTEESIKGLLYTIEKLNDKLDAVSHENRDYIEKSLVSVQSNAELRLQNVVLEKFMEKRNDYEDVLQLRIDKFKQEVDRGVKDMISTSMEHLFDESTYFPNNEFQTNPLLRKLVRDFDEKIYTICSDLSACKQLFVSQTHQPFYRCAQWLWTSGHLKLGSAVPWNLQTTNTDPDNFKWTADHFNIKIAEAGLYEINFAFFTKSKPSIQIVVNGESVLSAINSPSYVIQHSSGFITDGDGKVEQGTITGISLVDFIALPSKSTLSIHYHGVKKNATAHGFLGLKRL